ncbi:MAG: AFG1/ZapE family ATPase, partial [Pseudomonadota bacterium]
MTPIDTPESRYREDLAHGQLLPDEHQARAVAELERLFDRLEAGQPEPRFSLLPKFLRKRSTDNTSAVADAGLYIWGPVGRGKSYLVDTFFDCLPFDNKRRIHFHSFMRAVHRDLKSYPNEQNPLALVTK